MKTEAQQAVLALPRMRQQLVKSRVAQSNDLRGLLTEYGEVVGRGRAALNDAFPVVLARLIDRLPAVLIDTLRDQWNGLTEIDKRISEIERRLDQWMKQDGAIKAIVEIPGVGLLTTTASVVTLGDANAFRSGREFAAWIGLVPRQSGSGGKVALLGISKRGDTYLRTLLVHGARSVLKHRKDPQAWTEQLRSRRPLNVAIVAQANKTARTIWAILAHGTKYEQGHISTRPV